MPRTARIDIPHLLQHVIVRGNERRVIFIDDDDRRYFVKRFSALLVATGTDCLAWALLDNHLHLLLRPHKISLGAFMRRLLTGYAVTFNRRHRRSGHLFQNRYKSLVCEEEAYLLELVRYIHLNPLRAGIVSTIEQLDAYPWCGHASLMDGGELSGQTTDEVLSRFGKTIDNARRNYRRFIEDGVTLGRRDDLVGLARNKAARQDEDNRGLDARVLGSNDFAEELLRQTEVELPATRLPLEKIIENVCSALDLTLEDLLSPARSRHIAQARSLICHLAFSGGHSGVAIAHKLRLTGSAVSVAARRGREIIVRDPGLSQILQTIST
ncbi:MAG: transposase [Trichloromonas sp.]|jgi:REP element-mobilizing transposase RayT|nr:transposase [Trichloromonas sp.]